MLRIGLIGAGIMGITHGMCYRILAESLDLTVTAIADIDRGKAAELAEPFDADNYETGFELIEHADVDILDICLPTHLHASSVFIAPVRNTGKMGRANLTTEQIFVEQRDIEGL